MKMSAQIQKNTATDSTLTTACLASCQKLLTQIENTKDNIVAEFRHLLEAHEQLLRLALTEAEALAWQTEYPHLVFPILATEKAQAVAAWHARQQSMQQTNSRQGVAA